MTQGAFDSHNAFSGYLITDPLHINNIIENLKKGLSILSINIEKTNISFISAIIEVDGKYRHIVIDELKSESITNRNLNKDVISVAGKLEGVSVSFKSAFINYKDLSLPTHRILFPKSLEYKQRRLSHRVSIARELSPQADLLINGKWFHIGRICDLSEDGLCIVDNNNLLKDFANQQEIHQLKITLKNGENILCNMTSANILSDKNNKIRLGAKFSSLHEPEKSKLLKTMMSFERDNIKKGILR